MVYAGCCINHNNSTKESI